VIRIYLTSYTDYVKQVLHCAYPESIRYQKMRGMSTYKHSCSAVKTQFMNYLERNKILIDEQSVFRSTHSCETSLNLTLSARKEMIEDNKIIVAVFLDFKRAFETIDRELLMWTMEQYGIIGTDISWFRSYLSNKSPETKFYEKISDVINVQLGVLQGSVLSIAADTWDEAVNRMNDDLVSLFQWLTSNKLKLNVQKTKYMVITYKKNIPVDLFKVRIGDNDLECVKHMKNLGGIIDE
jgi:hypothetical protein